MPVVIRYYFTQQFPVPAQKAYEWCTNFAPVDQALMGEESAERHVTRLTEGTFLLTDVFHDKVHVEKQKLVQLYPDKLFWTSTHLNGPNKYSQFLYQITNKSEGTSRLDFTALHLEYTKKKLSKMGVKSLAESLRKMDSRGWKLLAEAMTKELVE